MAIENVQQLLTEQLGKHFVTESVIASITASNIQTGTGSAAASLHTTIPAGTTLFLAVTAITLTSGLAICYYDQVI